MTLFEAVYFNSGYCTQEKVENEGRKEGEKGLFSRRCSDREDAGSQQMLPSAGEPGAPVWQGTHSAGSSRQPTVRF